MAVARSPIDEVASGLGLSLQVLYAAKCPCRGLLDIDPGLGLFACLKCGKRGDSLALVRLVNGATEEEALRYLEEKAGLAPGEVGALDPRGHP